MMLTSRLALVAGLVIVCSSSSFSLPKSLPKRAPAAAAKARALAGQVEDWSRDLKGKNSAATYAKMSAFANQKNSGLLGARAALALGYFDYNRQHFADAEKWLTRAKADQLLRDYSIYWLVETHFAMGRYPDALADLKQFRESFPASVMTDQALQAYGEVALAANQPSDAMAALDAYPSTADKPVLLFLRAQLRERADLPLAAAVDYQQLYTRFPLAPQSKQAASKLDFLKAGLGDKMPPLSLDARLAHADALFTAKNWDDARSEYSQLLPTLSGQSAERAQLRILEAGVSLGGSPAELVALQIGDPDVDAERSFFWAQIYRSQQQEAQMVAAVEAAASRAPASKWTEQALFLAGNYFWVQLNRTTAASYYKRVADNFPTSADAISANWRVAWTAVIKRDDNAPDLVADHLRRYPGSQYSADSVYWLGRLAEEANKTGEARTYFQKLEDRFPQNYFAMLAATRLRALGNGPADDPEILDTIPPVPPAAKLGDRIPALAAERQARADALHTIGFDASAELELRAGYAATREPRLLLESAQAAVAANRFGAAIATVRQLYPQIESRQISDVPRDAWIISYALPFSDSIRKWSAKTKLDPMLTAGLIHQESAFSPDARSSANALGLMQLIPDTAHRIAKQVKVGYRQYKLLDPDYNVHLGTQYLANLRQQFDGVEYAIAAYNAGEDRVAMWTMGQMYREPAEFVDSIPFTETRDYVEIVMRNASIYRKLYGVDNESRKTSSRTRR